MIIQLLIEICHHYRFLHHKMEEIVEQVKEGEMPLESYTWMHKEANLTQEEKEILTNWAGQLQKLIAEKYQLLNR